MCLGVAGCGGAGVCGCVAGDGGGGTYPRHEARQQVRLLLQEGAHELVAVGVLSVVHLHGQAPRHDGLYDAAPVVPVPMVANLSRDGTPGEPSRPCPARTRRCVRTRWQRAETALSCAMGYG